MLETDLSTTSQHNEFSPLLHPSIIEQDGPDIAYNHPTPPLHIQRQLANDTHPSTFAASSATKEEEEIAAKGILPDGTKPVAVPKRMWRAKAKNVYEEPETTLNDDLDWMFEKYGKVMIREKAAVPPQRDDADVIDWHESIYEEELKQNLQWRDCPEDWRPIFEAVVKEFWDVFAKEGMMKPILGYLLHVDTGTSKPITCKQPRYGPHESRVIVKLSKALEQKDLIEDDDGPWGAQVVLASKPNQGHVHWSQYIFRLCVSYRQLNAITRPFTFYILRCDDAVDTVGGAKYFITMDLDAGYWQVGMDANSRERTAFYVPDGKKHWKVMPMGILNAHAFFVRMTVNFKIEWQELYQRDPAAAIKKLLAIIKKHKSAITSIIGKQAVINIEQQVKQALQETDPNASVIVDDVLLFDRNILTLIAYFVTCLEILKKYRVTVNLRKTRFLPARAEFVGRDLLPHGNSPAQSKYGTIKKLCAPATFSDIQMINGLFGYYAPWIPHLELEIQPWREYVKQKPAQGEKTEEEVKTQVRKLWTKTDDEQLERLKDSIISGPVLKRPNPKRRFYLKTDWSSNAMGAVLLQADITEEAEEAMLREIRGGKCEFDKAIKGLRLRPIAFISRICKGKERDYHSYVGEAATGLWAMRKYKQWLIGMEFTWISDCSGLTKFFEGTADITHTLQRWRLELLSLNFTIVHRPARMLVECDLLSRYQGMVESWRDQPNKPHTDNPLTAAAWNVINPTTEWPSQHIKPTVTGPNTKNRTNPAFVCDTARATWIIGATLNTFETAANKLGGQTMITAQTSEKEHWQEHYDIPDVLTFASRIIKQTPPAEWIIVNNMEDYISPTKSAAVKTIIETAITQGADQIFLSWTGAAKAQTTLPWKQLLKNATKHLPDLKTTARQVRGETTQAHINTKHTFVIMAHKKTVKELTKSFENHNNDPYATNPTITDVLDEPNENYDGYRNISSSNNNTVSTHQHNHTTTHKVNNIYEISPYLPPNTDMDKVFIQSTDGNAPAEIRTIRPREHISLLGYTKQEATDIFLTHRLRWNNIKDSVNKAIPTETWMQLLTPAFTRHSQHSKLNKKEDITALATFTGTPAALKQHTSAMTNKAINKFTTLPVPTGEQWKEHCKLDPDISLIIKTLSSPQPKEPEEDTHKLDRAKLTNQNFWRELKQGKLETSDGILYQFEEPKNRPIRQLKRAVVPTKLRQTIITAYHATPLSGHVGYHKTLYRITARFWWPGMTSDIREAVLGCGHCNAANATNHINQKIYQPTTIGEPFKVCGMNIWFPGKSKAFMRSASPVLKKTISNKAVITYLCNMTGFATVAFISNVDSQNMARISFSQFFTIRGMPRLILIDDGSENKGDLLNLCNILKLDHHTVSPESHDGILNERFHRYLNKTQKIGAADMRTFEEWAMNAMFATYAWNASPVDGTDIQRAFAAVSKHFNFPMDATAQSITEPPLKKRKRNTAQKTKKRIEKRFPMC